MNLEAFQEVPDAVKEVNKRIVTGANALGRLIVQGYNVTRPVLRKEAKGDADQKEERNTAENC
jgi:hypothetical protein